MSTIMFLRQISNHANLRTSFRVFQRAASSATNTGISSTTLLYERDPQPQFTDPETQKLLKSMTQLQLDKIFQKTTVADNSVDYKLMTVEMLEEEFRKSIERAKKRLQMPPVVQMKKDERRIISNDSALSGFSDTKYVITDITYGLRQSERKVVVRQTDGTLEYAPMEITKRMHQLYFPLNGRSIRIPRMFEDEHLQRCLDEQKYLFILNRMVVQFDPFEPEFHYISSRVYQHINETKQFDALRSTRHFGPMTFFFAWHRCIDDLLYDMVRRDYLQNATELIALLYKLHNMESNYKDVLKRVDEIKPQEDLALKELEKELKRTSKDVKEDIQSTIGKTQVDFEVDDLCLPFIEDYISKHALKKVQLELATQTIKEINAEKRQLFEGLNKVHGIS
ncbi:28S ribosomal protein S22, mitochondrial [Zeugodacus cucurbitae]|uniref:28S ribosomal protein S22, mitochondrial n=1 Tax=Zeugodacus cucurbitae TaxID=28588 RepID=UPI0023D921A3|nr:28S ribosomal protein S22, mitochondrial [Zeugodacus cucurbitae]